jgi:hypothetical protein
VREFLRTGRPAFAAARVADESPGAPQTCTRCGMPAWGEVCAFCKLVAEIETKRARAAAGPPA